MTNPNDPISPVLSRSLAELPNCSGLTKREYFAALAMQGIVANNHFTHKSVEAIATDAVALSNALIAALNREAK